MASRPASTPTRDGDEGGTYVWSKDEVEEILGPDAPAFEQAYDVTENGNWEGRTILRRVGDVDEQALRGAREKLLASRNARPQPARDDKVLTAWNGLMIAAFAEAGAVMNRTDWTAAAEAAADLLLRAARDKDGRLRRSWKDGQALHGGVLEDYANLAEGLLALYQATFEERWFVAARELTDAILGHFTDPQAGFFDTPDDHEALITRPKGLQDNAVPSGNAMATTVLLKLAAYTGEARYAEAAERAIAQVTAYAHRYPTAFAQWLSAITTKLVGTTEIAISGDPSSEEMRGSRRRAHPVPALHGRLQWAALRGAPSPCCTIARCATASRPPTCVATLPAAPRLQIRLNSIVS